MIVENTTELIMCIIYMELGAYKQDHFFFWRGISSVIELLICQHWSQFAAHQHIAMDDRFVASLRLKYLSGTYRVLVLKMVLSSCLKNTILSPSTWSHERLILLSPFHRLKIGTIPKWHRQVSWCPFWSVRSSPGHLAMHWCCLCPSGWLEPSNERPRSWPFH